jgi:hypothetical protein
MLDLRSTGKFLGAFKGSIRIECDGQEVNLENPQARANKRLAALKARLD